MKIRIKRKDRMINRQTRIKDIRLIWVYNMDQEVKKNIITNIESFLEKKNRIIFLQINV